MERLRRKTKSSSPEEGSSHRILGLDPGLQVTGYGLIDVRSGCSGASQQLVVVEAGIIRATHRRPGLQEDKQTLAERLALLFDGVSDVLNDFSPDVAVVEELYSTYRHPRTAILMGHARGVLFLAAARKQIPVVSYGATEMKRVLTGNGRASKAQIQRTVQQRLGLRLMPSPPDVADALGLALCHATRTSSQ